jgi:hypothetical protein
MRRWYYAELMLHDREYVRSEKYYLLLLVRVGSVVSPSALYA